MIKENPQGVIQGGFLLSIRYQDRDGLLRNSLFLDGIQHQVRIYNLQREHEEGGHSLLYQQELPSHTHALLCNQSFPTLASVGVFFILTEPISFTRNDFRNSEWNPF